MTHVRTLFKRELASYFTTPLAIVFLVVFLVMSGLFTFYMGQFIERGQADLVPFFNFHPWLYLFLMPALAMRLWAEERKSGTLELLMTLPVSLSECIVAKFLAAWCFAGIALLLTLPLWLTVSFLGDPDHGVIAASYVGSFLMAGAFLAIGSALSAATSSQVVAFVISVAVSFLFLVSGLPIVLQLFNGWVPQVILDAFASLSFLTHFAHVSRGVIELRDVFYFLWVIASWLFASAIIIDINKTAS